MMIEMQRLNRVKYAGTAAEVEMLKKNGFRAVKPADAEEAGQPVPSGQQDPENPHADPDGGAPAEGQPHEPDKKTGRAGKRKSGEKDGSDG